MGAWRLSCEWVRLGGLLDKSKSSSESMAAALLAGCLLVGGTLLRAALAG